MEAKEIVDIELMGRHYQFKCSPDKVDEFLATVDKLRRQLAIEREKSSLFNAEQLFMLAALHFAQEQKDASQNSDTSQQLNERLLQLQRKVQQALAADLKLETAPQRV